MALQPKKVPQNDIIRKVKETVDYNADLLIVDAPVTETGFNLVTEGRESIPVDLSESFVTRDEFLNVSGVPVATETNSGRIPIATQAAAESMEDDSSAMTSLKTLLLILKLGLVELNPDGSVRIVGNAEGQSLVDLATAATNADLISVLSKLLTQFQAPAIKALLNLQKITENGASTTKRVSLFGGLDLDNIEYTEEILPALVLGYDKKVYASSSLGGGSLDDEVVYLGCYQKPIEKVQTQQIPLVNAEDGKSVPHKLKTLTPIMRAYALQTNGQYQLLTDVTLSDPNGDSNNLILSIPGGSFTGFLELSQPPTTN